MSYTWVCLTALLSSSSFYLDTWRLGWTNLCDYPRRRSTPEKTTWYVCYIVRSGRNINSIETHSWRVEIYTSQRLTSDQGSLWELEGDGPGPHGWLSGRQWPQQLLGHLHLRCCRSAHCLSDSGLLFPFLLRVEGKSNLSQEIRRSTVSSCGFYTSLELVFHCWNCSGWQAALKMIFRETP